MCDVGGPGCLRSPTAYSCAITGPYNCADCATNPTGAGCSPRRRTAAHSGQSAVWSADDAEMALGDAAATAGAGASVRLAAPAQPASLCDESRGGSA